MEHNQQSYGEQISSQEITSKQHVLNVFPDARVYKVFEVNGYSIISQSKNHKGVFVSLPCILISDAWEQAWKEIQEEMLSQLENVS